MRGSLIKKTPVHYPHSCIPPSTISYYTFSWPNQQERYELYLLCNSKELSWPDDVPGHPRSKGWCANSTSLPLRRIRSPELAGVLTPPASPLEEEESPKPAGVLTPPASPSEEEDTPKLAGVLTPPASPLEEEESPKPAGVPTPPATPSEEDTPKLAGVLTPPASPSEEEDPQS